jgi:UPF0755 protein
VSGAGHEDTVHHPKERRTLTKVLSLTAMAVGAVLVLILVAAAWMTMRDSRARHESGSAVQVEIKPGSGSQAIARKLKSVGVIGNETTFRLRARISGADDQLKSGVYDLRVGMTEASVLRALIAGPPVTYVTVTIPEGFVVDQIAERFEKQAGIPRGEFAALAKTGASQFARGHPSLRGAYKGSLEGFLFPKTYRVKKGSSAREVIELMLDQFDEEIARVDVRAAASSGLNVNQLVTLASMIERESRLDSERPLISSVIHNRLTTDSFLKIDATIQYVLGDNRFRLTNQDTQIDSPYNTYTHKGLPPGPISNPGLKSLQAAANPAETPLLYYVLTGKDGSHTFTTNLPDFLAAKRKSKQVFGE